MIFALALLCTDGFYIINPIIKLSHIGTIVLLVVCLMHSRMTFRVGSSVILLCIIALGAIGTFSSLSPQNLTYFLSQIGLLTSCVLIFLASSHQIITPGVLHRLAKILILGSFVNYFILLQSDIDLLLEFSSLIGIDSSTSRYSLETAFGMRIPRMYFLSSEPSTHAITIVCLYVALMEYGHLSKYWQLGFFVNLLCTFSLTGIILFFLYIIWSHRNLLNLGLLGGLCAMILAIGVSQYSTVDKLFNLRHSPRIEQFSFASTFIGVKPTDIGAIPEIGSNVFSLWIYILLANGLAISAIIFSLLLSIGNIAMVNRVILFVIFTVTPISYFTAASFLMTRKR